MSETRVDARLRELADSPGVRMVLHAVLDRRDRKGRFPTTATVRTSDLELRDVARFFPTEVLRSKSGGRLVLHLGRLEELRQAEALDRGSAAVPLEVLFDELTGRRPGNLWRDREAWRARLREVIDEGLAIGLRRAQEAESRAADPALDELVESMRASATRGRGQWMILSRGAGMERVREAVARCVAAFLIARTPGRAPLRLDDLSLAVAGTTKALRPGTEDHRRFMEALCAADAELARQLTSQAVGSRPLRDRLLLEHLGVVTNQAPLEVLVKGELAIEMGGQRFDDTTRLAGLGHPTKLTYALLQKSERLSTGAEAVLTVENESAFHALAARSPERLVVYTQGQPGWPVTRLLARLAESRPDLSFEHAGDMDRSGLEILRTLRARTGLEIQPRWMDAATFERCVDRSLPMTPAEHERTRKLLRTWREPYGRELLERLVHSGRWLEQEEVLRQVARGAGPALLCDGTGRKPLESAPPSSETPGSPP